MKYAVLYFDEKLKCFMYYWGTADLKLRSFTNSRTIPSPTKLTHANALKLARSQKHYVMVKYSDIDEYTAVAREAL